MNTLSDMFKWECLNEQEDQKHPDETLPSTSKCGSRDFESKIPLAPTGVLAHVSAHA